LGQEETKGVTVEDHLSLIDRASYYFKKSFMRRSEREETPPQVEFGESSKFKPKKTLLIDSGQAESLPRHGLMISDMLSDEDSGLIAESTIAAICNGQTSL